MPRHAAPSSSTAGSRAIWTGTVGFGLVQIPVRLLTRERTDELAFHQLDRRDNSPIGYERVNRSTGERVEWKDVVKGFAIAKDQYVVVTDDDFKKANVQASQSIEIQDFVPAASIPPEFLERPYVLVPERSGGKAYRVLRDVMAKKKLAGVALFVLRTRQHLCAVLPEGELLSLELLRFPHELKSSDEATGSYRVPASPAVTSKELSMAEELVGRMQSRWDPARYKDSYRDDLLAAIHEKAETGTVEPRHTPAAAEGGGVVDLSKLLERSLAAAAKGEKKERGGRGRAAATATATGKRGRGRTRAA